MADTMITDNHSTDQNNDDDENSSNNNNNHTDNSLENGHEETMSNGMRYTEKFN